MLLNLCIDHFLFLGFLLIQETLNSGMVVSCYCNVAFAFSFRTFAWFISISLELCMQAWF